jgi:lipid-A-disaccharide synthase
VSARSDVRFEVAAASEGLAIEIERMLVTNSLRAHMRVVVGDAAATMQRVFAGIVASGTATLEAAYFRMPFVLVYRVSWPTYAAARMVVKTKHLGMPNILASREIVPEFIQHAAHPESIANAILQLMTDPVTRGRMTSEFDSIIEKLGEGGANEKAARVLLDELSRKS